MIKLSNILVLFCFFSIPSYAIDLNTYEGDEYWKQVDSLNWIDGYLECINTQFYEAFEIQFIDGGSTDGSWERICKFNQ